MATHSPDPCYYKRILNGLSLFFKNVLKAGAGPGPSTPECPSHDRALRSPTSVEIAGGHQLLTLGTGQRWPSRPGRVWGKPRDLGHNLEPRGLNVALQWLQETGRTASLGDGVSEQGGR